jgi:hypothetical protein
MRAYLQLQEQLHATQLAVERNRKEADETAAQSAAALNNRLQSLEQSLAGTRARELDVVQSSNRSMLFVAGSFAAMGFIAMLLVAYFQWRTINRLAEISAALPVPLDVFLQSSSNSLFFGFVLPALPRFFNQPIINCKVGRHV